MNRKQLLVLIAALVVIGGAGLAVFQKQRASWSRQSSLAGANVLKPFPVNAAAALVFTSGTSKLHVKLTDGTWKVEERDYPANFELVSTAIRQLANLKAVQDVNIGPSQLGRLELLEPKDGTTEKTGIKAEVLDASGKTLAAILLGKNHLKETPGFPGDGFPSGRYVMPLDGSGRVALVSETLNDLHTDAQGWIDKSFAQVQRVKSVKLSGTTPAQQWTVSRTDENAEWTLEDLKPDEKVDQGKLPAFAGSLASPMVTDVLPADTKPENVGLDKPSIFEITTFDGFKYTFRIGALKDEKWPVQLEVSADLAAQRTPGENESEEDKKRLDEEFAKKKEELQAKLDKESKLSARIFELPRYSFDSLLKDRSTMLADKPAEPAAEPSSPTAAATPAPVISATTPALGVPAVATDPVQAPTPTKKKKK